MTSLKTLGLPVALVAALSLPPDALAQEGGTSDTGKKPAPDIEKLLHDMRDGLKSDTRESLKTIERLIDASKEDLQRQIEGLRKQLEQVEAVRKQVDDLRGDHAVLKQSHNATRDELDALRKRLTDLEEQVKSQAKSATTTRQSAYFPDGGSSTVRLYNSYDRPVTVVIQGRDYRLEPNGSTAVPNLPVGSLTYDVLTFGAEPRRTTTVLRSNETLNIEIYDPVRGPVRGPGR